MRNEIKSKGLRMVVSILWLIFGGSIIFISYFQRNYDILIYFIISFYSLAIIATSIVVKRKKRESDSLNQANIPIHENENIIRDSVPIHENEDLNTDSDILYKIGFDRYGNYVDVTPKLICPVCNHRNYSKATICSYCKTEFEKCLICERILGSDEIVRCPNCNAGYHKAEFLEWLKVKAECKKCHIQIDLWEFQKYLNEQNQQELETIFCPKCGNSIPADAKFCNYCGIIV